MKKYGFLSILFAALVLFVSVPLFADSDEPDGRTVAEKGIRGSVSGVLVYEKSEWYLKDGNKTYDLHLGLYGHDETKTGSLGEGDSATVEGFILENHIAPVTLVSNGKTYRFRSENGSPLWAGQGNRRNS